MTDIFKMNNTQQDQLSHHSDSRCGQEKLWLSQKEKKSCLIKTERQLQRIKLLEITALQNTLLFSVKWQRRRALRACIVQMISYFNFFPVNSKRILPCFSIKFKNFLSEKQLRRKVQVIVREGKILQKQKTKNQSLILKALIQIVSAEHIIYNKKMNHSYFPWSKTTFEFQLTLSQLPLLSCVKIQKIQRSFGQDDLLQQSKLLPKLELQLRSRFFIIFNCLNDTVLDAFEAQPSVFVLIKQLSQTKTPNPFQGQNQIQNVQSLIKFGDRTAQNCFISLYCQITKQNLIELDRTITKTYSINLDFHNQFKPVRRIGQGLTSTVYQAVKLINKTQVTVKAFKKSHYFGVSAGKGQKAFLKEFKMLSECCHQNVCRFGGVYQTENTIYIVQELYEKPLTSFLCAPGQIKREDVIKIMQELLSGVSYLHSKGIIHRDLKPENIMFRKQIKNNTYKSVIIDLGLAEYTNTQDFLFQKCGTPGYVAPEVFDKGAKSAKCDIFSLGIIFYNLLYKLPVFKGDSKEEVLSKNRMGKMNLDTQRLEEQDELIRDLLLKMLTIDQQKRISAESALQHPLFQTRKFPSTPKTNVSLQDQNYIKNQMKFYGAKQIEE